MCGTSTAAGSAQLVESFSAARNRGGFFKLIGVTKRLNDLLVISKLLSVFDCFDTQQDAIDSFGVRVDAR